MIPTSPRLYTRGRRVALCRLDRGYTQEFLARQCGCSLRTIQRIEADENKSMSQPLIEALNRALGMPLSDLVGTRKAGAQ